MLIKLIYFYIQTLGIGFVTLNSMLLTMSTRYWLETRLTWMKAKGSVLLWVCVCVCVCMCLHMHAHAGVRMHTCISFPWLLLMLTWWWPYFQAVPTSKGQALADEYGIKFFETVSKLCCLYWLVGFFFLSSFFLCCEACELQSAKTNLNVEEVFFSIARDIKQRLADTDSRAEV